MKKTARSSCFIVLPAGLLQRVRGCNDCRERYSLRPKARLNVSLAIFGSIPTRTLRYRAAFMN